MAMKIRVSGATETITVGKVQSGGVERRLKTWKVMDGGTLREVARFVDPLSLSSSPSTVSGVGYSNAPLTITTNATTASPVGGEGPYTYSWALVSSTGGDTPTINSPSFATTSFTQTNVTFPGGSTAVFRCTVTDSFGETATADVDAQFFNFGGGPL